MTDIPTGYEIRAKDRGGHELLIDGQPFPWTIAADGPRVERGRHGFHFLWVPILINAPMGDGEPDGELLVTDGTGEMQRPQPTVRHRDAITGQYVDALLALHDTLTAADRPETTVRETRKP